MTIISDFTKPAAEIILDLVNATNDINLRPGEVILNDPVVGDGNVVDVTIEAVEGSGYGGEVTVHYQRLDLQEFADIVEPEGLVIHEAEHTMLSDLLPELNAILGTRLEPEDIIDGPIEGWSGQPASFFDVTITAAPTCLVYYGSVVVRIDDKDIDLNTVITVKILSGLNLPVLSQS